MRSMIFQISLLYNCLYSSFYRIRIFCIFTAYKLNELYFSEKLTPMDERCAVDQLLDYPKDKELHYETHKSNKRFLLTPADPILNTKYVLFKKDDLIFFAYDSYGAKAHMSQTFTGVYSLSGFEDNFECEITKRYWLDNFRTRKKKTGVKRIDDKLTIRSHSDRNMVQLINEKIMSLFLELNNTITPVKLIIKNDYLRLIGDFKSKSIIGLETNQWIYKTEEIEALLDMGEEIIEEIKEISFQPIL